MKNLEQAEILMQQWIAANPNFRTSGLTDTIPVVVHVVWKTAAQNISDLQVQNTILALNQDYGRTAPDTANTPAVWKPIAASTGIQFCLAVRDPLGAPTNGIERRQTTAGPFTTDDMVKSYLTGGLYAWDVTKYFNIWICDLAGGLGGYGEFPTAVPSNTFGNVTDYTLVGLTGWVPSHESGHCFNLRHIWGDDNGACTGSDLVADTPNQADATNSPCPAFPELDACQTASPGIMFMNYMDYGSSACKNIFTQGQQARVQAALHNLAYSSLLTSDGCIPVVLQQTDAGSPAVLSPSGLVCDTTIIPIVRIRNWGTDTLTSVTINYQLDANPLQTYSWNGQLASLATDDVTLPLQSFGGGNHTFICYTTNPNGLADGNAANDTSNSTFNVVPSGQPTPFSYGFEPVTFPPTGWDLDNQDGSVSWARTTGAAKTGIASMWFNSINYPCNGCIDIITLPNLNLTSIASPQMTFQVAYRMLSDPGQFPNWSDTLRVDISTDCGITWTNLYFKYSTNLTTIVPTFSTTPFVPTQNDWRLETIDLTPYASNDNVLFRFKVSSDYENNMYVDDINILAATGISEIKNNDSFSVYPNPASDILNIKMNSSPRENSIINIFNMLGNKIFEREIKANNNHIQLNLSDLVNGVYSLNLKSDSENKTVKLIIKK
ncbi:MAG TPA: T9SS type A sorting domain-containing protein [Bacteroidia bacterium]|nr:T9SS type A sorting domain-containing protein [Bacteroidia bacterium]